LPYGKNSRKYYFRIPGSGKTTAIIKILGQKNIEEHWAVIINEFRK